MFQLPPGMSYKQFQAAGMPGYKSDALPYREGGYSAGSRTPPNPQVQERYHQSQPVQSQSQGTPYGGKAPWGDLSAGWNGEFSGPSPQRSQTQSPGYKPYGSRGIPTPEQMQEQQMQMEIDMLQRKIDTRSRQAGQQQHIDSLKNQLNGFPTNTFQPKPASGSSPWGGFGNDVFTPQTSGQSPYTNSQGQGFAGSMSFAPNTPVSYQNQAYGKFANSQGYYQQPQENLPTFKQGQAQPIQPPSQGTPLMAPAVKPPSPAWSAPQVQSQPQGTSYGQAPWGGQRTQVGANMSQPMSRWSYR